MSTADFDEFYTATSGRLVRQMYLLIGDASEAEDVVHEAYERAWLRWPTVSGYAAPEAWVRTVARRLAVSRWRKTRNSLTAWRRRSDREDSTEPSEDHVALVAALRQLPEAQRVAIVLHHLADLPVDQVAAETSSSVPAVKSRLQRGRTALAELLSYPELVQAEGESR